MSEEEKKKADELAAAALASEQKKKEEEKAVDYKALLEEEKKRVAQAEFTIESLKKKQKEKKEDGDDDTPPTIDQEEIFRMAREEARKEIEKVQSGFAQDALKDALTSASSDPAEQELIKFHYENSIKQSGYSRGSILEDIQKAKLLANKNKLEKMESELKKAGLSKKTSSGGSAGTYHADETIELSPEEENWIQKASIATGRKPEAVRAKLMANKSR